MALSLEEIKELLKKPKNKQQLQAAIDHEDHVRFHVETYTQNRHDLTRQVTVFLNWVRQILPKDKFKIFLTLFKTPTPVIPLTASIFTELKRVFESVNPVAQYSFKDTSFAQDWNDYKKNELELPEKWKSDGWDIFKAAINSFVVVDLPEKQSTAYPSPYFYFLDVRAVLDYGKDKSGVSYILFKESDTVLVAIDDAKYTKLSIEGTKVKSVLSESTHDLGYCPADFFWDTALNRKELDVKASPISAQLSNLDWLLFFMVSKKHLDLYAAYPIYSGYESDCDFENNATGDYCDGGYLRGSDENYILTGDGSVHQCPVCAEKKIVGVGSFIEVPIPSKDEPDMRNPISVTPADDKSLTYNVGEIERLWANIYQDAVGKGGESVNKNRLNEMQVKANYESKNAMLLSIKTNFERIIKFTEDTICRLRYGTNFEYSTISLGTEFFDLSVEDLYAKYKAAKETGAPVAELDAITAKIAKLQYRNNPSMLRRVEVLAELEPYRHLTLAEILSLKKSGNLSEKLFQIKINFSRFVNQFERENTNVVDFGANLDFSSKIAIIQQKLYSYVDEENNTFGARNTNASGTNLE